MKTTDNLKEQLIVVDKNDHILGYKTREECHHHKDWIHRAVHLAVFNEEGKILLQKRSITKDRNPGLYTLSVTGHAEKGDSYKSAMKRELKEELGIDINFEYVGKFMSIMTDQTEMVALYKTVNNGPFRINKKEITSVKFFTKEEIKNLFDKLTPNAKKSLKILKMLTTI